MEIRSNIKDPQAVDMAFLPLSSKVNNSVIYASIILVCVYLLIIFEVSVFILWNSCKCDLIFCERCTSQKRIRKGKKQLSDTQRLICPPYATSRAQTVRAHTVPHTGSQVQVTSSSCMHAGCTMTVKLGAYVIKKFKIGYQWTHKKNLCPKI